MKRFFLTVVGVSLCLPILALSAACHYNSLKDAMAAQKGNDYCNGLHKNAAFPGRSIVGPKYQTILPKETKIDGSTCVFTRNDGTTDKYLRMTAPDAFWSIQMSML
ncbi:MAG: hypothetical protein COB66_07335 [Coxiella sp. (in: Bacteria)]|nr:MAG: hypothetical protein COB66_07335 [Coxiella sp. (in: g-proteobacteria)]